MKKKRVGRPSIYEDKLVSREITIRLDQDRELRKRHGKASETIRNALDKYLNLESPN